MTPPRSVLQWKTQRSQLKRPQRAPFLIPSFTLMLVQTTLTQPTMQPTNPPKHKAKATGPTKSTSPPTWCSWKGPIGLKLRITNLHLISCSHIFVREQNYLSRDLLGSRWLFCVWLSGFEVVKSQKRTKGLVQSQLTRPTSNWGTFCLLSSPLGGELCFNLSPQLLARI